MDVVLGSNAYGKAEIHVVRVLRDTPRHEILDRTVSTMLRGDFADAYVAGDQHAVLPTDSQKNTVHAFVKDLAGCQPEELGLALCRHFLATGPTVTAARVEVVEHAWQRVAVEGRPHEHTFVQGSQETRTATVTVEGTGDGERVHLVAGIAGLVLLKSTGSEFHGFRTDPYTTLEPTDDRIMATSLAARWRYASAPADWAAAHATARTAVLERYAGLHSLALQQTLWEIGRAVAARLPEVVEVRLSAPNRHHFLVDLSPFGRANPGEVFHADDRPYGLIQATVLRAGAALAPAAWPGWESDPVATPVPAG